MKEDILKKTAKEYFEEGELALLRGKFNSSVVLFFKALVTFSDLYLLKQTGQTPSSHSNRFQISKIKFPEVYDLLDKDFPFYQDSYGKIMSKELAEVIKEDAKSVAKKENMVEISISPGLIIFPPCFLRSPYFPDLPLSR